MNFSFIVTSYNIAAYIGECLESLRPCVDPGDEVIVVDDGSTDETADLVTAFAAAGGYGQDVALRLVLLGANTPGGVGIPGNIGLDEALRDGSKCEAVFFVDGDDWLVGPGFRACRRQFEATRPDILIGNYLEYDTQSARSRPPADQARWSAMAGSVSAGPGNAGLDSTRRDRPGTRLLALSMIAVPWRKIYRSDFLKTYNLRFPQGDFFYEDNPFHWEVCLAAATIGFVDQVLCQHRINRPGQTMAATGVELTAFFTHFATITASLDAADVGPGAPERLAAAEWLLGNMAWHLDRLRPQAWWTYALAAAPALAGIPPDLWRLAVATRFEGTAVAKAGEQLRRLDPGVVVALWQGERGLTQLDQINRKLDALTREVGRLSGEATAHAEVAASTEAKVSALHVIAEFEALRALAARPEPEVGAQVTPGVGGGPATGQAIDVTPSLPPEGRD